MSEIKLLNKVKYLVEAELSKIKLFPYDPDIYAEEEIGAARNYLKDLAGRGELLATGEHDIDRMSDEKILKLTNREFEGGLQSFVKSDVIEKYKNVMSGKPIDNDEGEPQDEFSGAGGVAGFVAPLGQGAKGYRKKKHNKVSARSFGGGKRKKVGQGKYMSKGGTTFPKYKKNIYDS